VSHPHHELNALLLRRDALNGDAEAIEALYQMALKSLPAPSGNSRDKMIALAIRKVLTDATWERLKDAQRIERSDLYVDEWYCVTLPKLRKRVLFEVAGRASDRTVDRFLKDDFKMQPVIEGYIADFYAHSLAKSRQ